jgi:hypothetical protein
MNLRHLTTLLIIVICCSCRRSKQSSCRLTYEDVLKDNAVKVSVTSSPDGKIEKIHDVGTDSTIGGTYRFYDNGQLKDYFFFRTPDGLGYGYKEKYDSMGRLIEVEGSPNVWTNIKAVGDSFNVKWHLFSLNKLFEEIYVRDSLNQVLKSKIYVDTVFSNMTCVEFSYRGAVKKNEHFKVLLDVHYRNKCARSELLPITDTLDLVWEPK